MAGNTGKMTADAVRTRGPRIRLASIARLPGPNTLGFRNFQRRHQSD